MCVCVCISITIFIKFSQMCISAYEGAHTSTYCHLYITNMKFKC